MATSPAPARAVWKTVHDRTVLELSGDWRSGEAFTVEGQEPGERPQAFDASKLGSFDSMLPAFLISEFRKRGKPGEEGDEQAAPDLGGLPEDLRALIELALAVPERTEARRQEEAKNPLHRLGEVTTRFWENTLEILNFTGQAVLSILRFFTGKARFRWRDFWLVMQECGVQALPIVALISFLIGLILAFVGNVQLKNFGANIYVADLVGIAMVREMGVVMTGIIISGRTASSFAAHIGSMKANQEIDALRTFGFDSFDYLVLPRIVALVLMMPILTIYSNIVGIAGGMLVGMLVDIPPVLYWHQTVGALTLTTASLGVFKSFFFGAAIAMSGCMQGMKAGNSSAAVGAATTRAVVASITAVIVLDSAFAAIFTILNI